jgi:hypothetical protein
MTGVALRLWEGWKRFAHWLGGKQAELVYFVLYFLVVGPIALVRNAFVDPFRYRHRRDPSFWVPRPEVPATLDEARRQ